LTQRDLEGFFSSLIYNKQNYTKVHDVLKSIYDEDEDDLIKQINERQRGPPPHLNLGVDEKRRFSENIATSPLYHGELGALTSGKKQKRLNEILKKVDDKIFVERKKAFDLYKMFDVDRDGFVSRTDFVTKAEEILLVPKEDIPVLVEYLDPTKKGYVNFKEFHKKIRSNAHHQDEDNNPTVFPSVVPSKENFDKVSKIASETKTRFEDSNIIHRPETAVLRPTSRFGNAPAWKNTFLNLQAPLTSPMFIAEKERFSKNPQASVLPATEDKEKKQRIWSAKAENLKLNQEMLQKRAETDMQKFDALEQARLKTKCLSLASHEHSAKLRNNFSLL